jgi:hypothetical protein
MMLTATGRTASESVNSSGEAPCKRSAGNVRSCAYMCFTGMYGPIARICRHITGMEFNHVGKNTVQRLHTQSSQKAWCRGLRELLL